MRISGVFTAILLLIGVLSVGKSSYDLSQSAKDYATVRNLEALEKARTAWIDATVALSLERSVTQVALALDTPAPADFRAIIDQQRALSQDLFTQAIAGIGTLETVKAGPAFLQNAQRALAKITALRSEVDTMLAQDNTRRAAARAYALPYEIKAEIAHLKTLADMLQIQSDLTSSDAIALSLIQAKAWEVREYAGRARTYYAIATLTSEPIPAASLVEANIDGARAASAWESIANIGQSVVLPERLQNKIAQVQQSYFDNYLPVLAQLERAMPQIEEGSLQAYPVGFSAFFDLSNESLGQMAALSRHAGAEVINYWAGRRDAARDAVIYNALAVVAVIAMVAGAYFIVRLMVSSRIAVVTRAIVAVSNGDLAHPVERKKHDLQEVVDLVKSLGELKAKLATAEAANAEREQDKRVQDQVVAELTQGLRAMSDGNLAHQITQKFGSQYDGLCEDFNDSCARLRGLIGAVIESGQLIENSALGMSEATKDVSQRIQRQSVSLGEASAAVNELSVSVKSNADIARETDQRVIATKTKVEQSGGVILQAVGTMEEIKSSSEEISQIVGMIDDISLQTNLLALNAGVEAARAGQFGRGFAVVASEVRALAQRTTEASKQVYELISRSSQKVESGVSLVADAGTALSEIGQMMSEINQMVGNISSTSQEQAMNLEDVNKSVAHLDRATQQNAELVGEVSDASNGMIKSAAELRRLTGQFSVENGRNAAGGPSDNLRLAG